MLIESRRQWHRNSNGNDTGLRDKKELIQSNQMYHLKARASRRYVGIERHR